MNERIKLLKHQASVWCDENIPEQFSEETNGYGSAWEEKFAELIVAECVKKCDFVAAMAEITNTGEMARKTKATADSCAQMIEQHFGVEE
jgi:hypothetical protein